MLSVSKVADTKKWTYISTSPVSGLTGFRHPSMPADTMASSMLLPLPLSLTFRNSMSDGLTPSFVEPFRPSSWLEALLSDAEDAEDCGCIAGAIRGEGIMPRNEGRLDPDRCDELEFWRLREEDEGPADAL